MVMPCWYGAALRCCSPSVRSTVVHLAALHGCDSLYFHSVLYVPDPGLRLLNSSAAGCSGR